MACLAKAPVPICWSEPASSGLLLIQGPAPPWHREEDLTAALAALPGTRDSVAGRPPGPQTQRSPDSLPCNAGEGGVSEVELLPVSSLSNPTRLALFWPGLKAGLAMHNVGGCFPLSLPPFSPHTSTGCHGYFLGFVSTRDGPLLPPLLFLHPPSHSLFLRSQPRCL